MALSAYEERVFAELEAELRSDREHAARRMQLVVCVLGGMALLSAGRLGTVALELAVLSGLSTPSIQLCCTVLGAALLVAAACVLGRAWRRRAPA